MRREYKDAIERISLSDSDKARILDNVKKACENRETDVQGTSIPDQDVTESRMTDIQQRPNFSLRRMGTVAAACLVFALGIGLIYNQITGNHSGVEDDIGGNLESPGPEDEVVWVELDSIEEIGEKTDCKTYTLSNVSREYRVARIEVANEQHHVRITYNSKKEEDRILFEYKETGEAVEESELVAQFNAERTLSTETVGDTDVTMYGAASGDEQCSGMTWQNASCTFAVRMTRARSKKEARALVSGATEGLENARPIDKREDDTKEDKTDGYNPNAIGWQGDEGASGPVERRKILKGVSDRLGFRIVLIPPAEQGAYKQIGEYESFAFYYPQYRKLRGRKIYGYAGWEGCPEGVLEGFDELDQVSVNGVSASVYENDRGGKLYQFRKQGIQITFLIDGSGGGNDSRILGELLSVLRISMDDGISDDEPDNEEEPGNEEKNNEEKALAVQYREQAQKIQDAVAERSLHKLAAYMVFPLAIDGVGTAEREKEFLAMDASKIFHSSWVDAVVSYDIYRIDPDTDSFVMGTDENSLVCEIQDKTVVITGLFSTELKKSSDNSTPKATPLAE